MTREAVQQLDYLLVGGGTGGHVFPAVAIAEALAVAQPAARIGFAGMVDSFESRTLGNFSWPFFALPAAPLKGKRWMAQCRAVGVVGRGVVAAYRLLGRVRPRCVIGTGGYVSAPVVMAARARGIPVVLQEQNSVPGLTNRWLGRVARTVCTTYADSARYFRRTHVVQAGLPLRRAIAAACGTRADLSLAVPRTLLAMGGSQGARVLNDLVLRTAALLDRTQWRVVHIVGKFGDVAATQRHYADMGIAAEVHAFVTRMDELYPHVHAAISRSGASSAAELALAGIPTVFVPFPFATDDHQQRNAEAIAAGGGATVIRERDATPEQLATALHALTATPDVYAQRQQQMRAAAQPDAAARVAAECVKVTIN